jgi:hypothetical protein
MVQTFVMNPSVLYDRELLDQLNNYQWLREGTVLEALLVSEMSMSLCRNVYSAPLCIYMIYIHIAMHIIFPTKVQSHEKLLE